MSTSRILLVQGHPDPACGHLGHAVVDACAAGAQDAGHTVRHLDVARLDFPLRRTRQDWRHGSVPPALVPAPQDLLWTQHVVLCFALWMGDMLALLKGFLKQVARPGLNGEPPRDDGVARWRARMRRLGRAAD